MGWKAEIEVVSSMKVTGDEGGFVGSSGEMLRRQDYGTCNR